MALPRGQEDDRPLEMGRAFGVVAGAAEREIGRTAGLIAGRVAEVRRGKSCWITLVSKDAGAVEGERSINVLVPEGGADDEAWDEDGEYGQDRDEDLLVVGATVEVTGTYFVRRMPERLQVALEFRASSLRILDYPRGGTPVSPGVRITAPLRTIGLVTSDGSAGEADFLEGLRRGEGSQGTQGSEDQGRAAKTRKKKPGLVDCVRPFPTALERSVFEIAEAIRRAAAAKVDLIVVTRGGGDPAMLMKFSHPAIVDAVRAASRHVPVMVAIGHANDHVECERVASYVAITPTDAAHMVVDLHRKLVLQVARARRRKRMKFVLQFCLGLATAAGLLRLVGRLFGE